MSAEDRPEIIEPWGAPVSRQAYDMELPYRLKPEDLTVGDVLVFRYEIPDDEAYAWDFWTTVGRLEIESGRWLLHHQMEVGGQVADAHFYLDPEGLVMAQDSQEYLGYLLGQDFVTANHELAALALQGEAVSD